MNKKDSHVEAVSTINYQFTAIPTNLFLVLDNNCRSTLFSLIQLSSYYAKEDGYFFRTNSDLEFETNLSKNVINATLDALYINGIIDVIPSAKGKGKKQSGKHFKVNFEKFLDYENISLEDAMKNEEYKIYTPNYKGTYTPSFNNTTLVTSLVPTLVTSLVPTLVKSDNNINNIENKDNIKNKETIYNKINKENNNINILEKKSEEIEVIETSISENNKEENNLNIKEVGFIDNPTSINEKEDTECTPMGNGTDDEDEALDMIFGKEEKINENNTAFQPTEVGMQIIEEKETPSMKEKIYNNFNDCLNRLGDGVDNKEQLKEKSFKFNRWLTRLYEADSITYTEYQDMTEQCQARFIDILVQLDTVAEEKLKENETSTNEYSSIEDEFFNNKEEKEEVNKEQLLPNVRIASTKEQLIADLEEYKNTIINQENLEDAKGRFKQYLNSKDKLIREYELITMVADIIKEIDTQIEANKMFLTTFNIQDKESITEAEKTQEIASCEATKGIVGYRVDDSEDYPF